MIQRDLQPRQSYQPPTYPTRLAGRLLLGAIALAGVLTPVAAVADPPEEEPFRLSGIMVAPRTTESAVVRMEFAVHLGATSRLTGYLQLWIESEDVSQARHDLDEHLDDALEPLLANQTCDTIEHSGLEYAIRGAVVSAAPGVVSVHVVGVTVTPCEPSLPTAEIGEEPRASFSALQP